MYAKLINGAFIAAPSKLHVGRTIVYNPSAAQYLADGWKPVIYTAEPETAPGYYAEPSWVDDGDSIVQTWTIVEEPADMNIPDDEAFAILIGEDVRQQEG